ELLRPQQGVQKIAAQQHGYGEQNPVASAHVDSYFRRSHARTYKTATPKKTIVAKTKMMSIMMNFLRSVRSELDENREVQAVLYLLGVWRPQTNPAAAAWRREATI